MVRLYVSIMLSKDFSKFLCLRGTPLGLLVVPEVCRKRQELFSFGLLLSFCLCGVPSNFKSKVF